jgi:hypothetical protein
MAIGHQNICLNIQILEGTDDLKRPSDSKPADLVRFHSKNGPALKRHFSGRGWVDARDEVEEGRLTGSVGTDDPHDLTLLGRKTDSIQSPKAIELFAQSADF